MTTNADRIAAKDAVVAAAARALDHRLVRHDDGRHDQGQFPDGCPKCDLLKAMRAHDALAPEGALTVGEQVEALSGPDGEWARAVIVRHVPDDEFPWKLRREDNGCDGSFKAEHVRRVAAPTTTQLVLTAEMDRRLKQLEGVVFRSPDDDWMPLSARTRLDALAARMVQIETGVEHAGSELTGRVEAIVALTEVTLPKIGGMADRVTRIEDALRFLAARAIHLGSFDSPLGWQIREVLGGSPQQGEAPRG